MRRSGTLILCYHRVAEGVEDPFYLCVRPDNFAAHLEELSRSRATWQDVEFAATRVSAETERLFTRTGWRERKLSA